MSLEELEEEEEEEDELSDDDELPETELSELESLLSDPLMVDESESESSLSLSDLKRATAPSSHSAPTRQHLDVFTASMTSRKRDVTCTVRSFLYSSVTPPPHAFESSLPR